MKEKLHPFHVSILVFMMQAGVIVFSLPRLLAEHIGYNGWVSLFIFSAIAAFNIFLIALVFRLGNGKSIFQILEDALPKAITFPLYAFLVSVWTMLGCLVAKQYVVIFQLFVFPTAHPMFLKIFIDVLTLILVVKGIYSISKAATTFFWIVIWTTLLLLFFFKSFQWINLTSFWFQNSSDMLIGSLSIYNAFLGYVLVLLLIPYSEKKGFAKAVFIGNIITTFTYIAVSLICFGFYSLGQLKKLKYPVIDLFAYISFPFVERIDNLFFGFFLFTTIMGITIYIWSALETMQRILPKANKHWLAFGIIVCSYIITWIPDVVSEVEKWLMYIGFFELGIAFGLPLLLLTILLIKKEVKTHE